VSTTAETVTPSPAFQSELEALKRCPPYGGAGGDCQAFWAFTAERRDAMTLAEEETLLTLLGGASRAEGVSHQLGRVQPGRQPPAHQ